MKVSEARKRIENDHANGLISWAKASYMQQQVTRIACQYQGSMRARNLEAWSDHNQVNFEE